MLTATRPRLWTLWLPMHGEANSVPSITLPPCKGCSKLQAKFATCALCTALRNVRSQDPPTQILTATFFRFSSCGRAQQTYAT